MPSASGDNNPSKTLHPHHTDFTGRDPPPKEGYSWDQIKNAIRSRSLHVLRRTDKGQYEYEQWQDQIDRGTYKNVGEYIVFEVLRWPTLEDPADTQTATHHLSKEDLYKTIEPRLTLRLNHYPFPVQESIQYFVLWSTRDMSLLSERDRLDKYLRLQFNGYQDADSAPLSEELLAPKAGKKKQWMWFVNPIELRSVTTVHHIHVFVRDVDLSESCEVIFERD
ncbi:hypothetical protein FBU30_008642 [Linnemannia zychae]|nr:hypothetical protein FBU30_008642 [Linnemannia zychae]